MQSNTIEKERLRGASHPILACAALSGFAGLVMEVTWTRVLALLFGSTYIAVAIVLSVFMLGLAAGGLMSVRLSAGSRRPNRLYGGLELFVGAYGIVLTTALLAARSLTAFVSPDAIMRLEPVVTLLLLIPPTFAMGATLPILAQATSVNRSARAGNAGLLNGINIAGGVIGAIAAGFVTIPYLGLMGSAVVAACANVLAAVIAYRCHAEFRPQAVQQSGRQPGAQGGFHLRIPLLAFLTGAAFLGLEIVWARLSAHVLSGADHAFAVMLAATLAGSAIGSTWGARNVDNAETRLPWTLLIAACVAAIAYMSASVVIDQSRPVLSTLVCGAGAFASVLFIGRCFPLTIACLPAGLTTASALGLVYGASSIGAAVGSILVGYWILPATGLAVSTSLMGATLVAAAFLAWQPTTGGRTKLGLVGVASLLWLAAVLPTTSNILNYRLPKEELGLPTLFQEVGRIATVDVRSVGDYLSLRSDGFPEAVVPRLGAAPARLDQFWLGALPTLARPNAKSAFVVGLGGGGAIAGLGPQISRVDVAEIEPAVARAADAMAQSGQFRPMSDARVKLLLGDARLLLSASGPRYDIIVSQPSHPWLGASANLYTAEFYRTAARRLTPDGVLVQWLDASYLDQDLLRVMLATMLDAFPEVAVFEPTPQTLIMLASRKPIEVEAGFTGHSKDARAELARFGLATHVDAVIAQRLDSQGVKELGRGAKLNKDGLNRLASQSRPSGDGLSKDETDALFAGHAPKLNLSPSERAYAVGQLAALGFLSRAKRMISDGTRTNDALAGTVLETVGADEDARSAFERAFMRDPNDPVAAWGLVKRELVELSYGQGTEAAKKAEVALPRAARTVLTAWSAARQQDWDGIARSDAELASVRPIDPWYADAVRLRAAWRIAGAAANATSARAAISILDAVLPASGRSDLLLTRLSAGAVLGDDRVIDETAWAIADHWCKVSKPSQAQVAQEAALVAAFRARSTPRSGSVVEKLSKCREQT